MVWSVRRIRAFVWRGVSRGMAVGEGSFVKVCCWPYIHTKTDGSGRGPASFPPDQLSLAQE